MDQLASEEVPLTDPGNPDKKQKITLDQRINHHKIKIGKHIKCGIK